MNSKVQNQVTKTPKTIQINDKDILTDMLQTEKNMGVNMTVALNEASNEYLYNELYNMFKKIKESQRNIYELAFRKGWYCLEKAKTNKITEEYNKLNQSLSELE